MNDPEVLIAATNETNSELKVKQPTRVEAVYLQLVMEAIWNEAKLRGSRELNVEILDDLGGVKSIVQEYLNKAVKKLNPEQTEIAFRIFDYLVMPSGDKVFYTRFGLATKIRKDEEELDRVLEVLSDSRILKQVDPSPNRPDEPRYTIFHDRLAEPILKWQSEYIQQKEIEKQKEVLKQERKKSKNYKLAFAAACITLLVLSSLSIYAWTQQALATEKANDATEARTKAEEEKTRANDAAEEAIRLQEIAQANETEATKQWKRAEEEKKIAALQRQEAEKQTKLTKEAEEVASKAAEEAKRERVRAEREAQLAKGNKEEAEKNADIAKQQKAIADEALEKLNAKITNTFQDLINNSKDENTKNTLINLLQDLSNSGEPSTNINEPVTDGDPVLQKRWKPGQTLHIKFLGGKPAIQEKVKEIAQEWTKYANLKFEFNSSQNAEIRISFDSASSWSFIGTDALKASGFNSASPTMDLGILESLNPDDKQFRRTVLHEFGHVLGFIHEYQHASADIPWNKTFIYNYFAGPPNYWNKAQVDHNLFRKYKSGKKSFDPKSIMVFTTIPREWLLDNSFQPITELSTDLSDGDKAYAREIYPFE